MNGRVREWASLSSRNDRWKGKSPERDAGRNRKREARAVRLSADHSFCWRTIP
eukprot:CAMPEP_0177616438 /NCGR_PEP_ID=MMETSP0419_2-20121207/24156_1 /TAXON_ID=582737 /ORGANISM="Tetraselmis sp., Strain GSL018" /LENGTH=52 /DNA_ID=CAMNT_0019114497 /DNA_START=264 /DNA_END=419 /DNA_ORIENTATION=+